MIENTPIVLFDGVCHLCDHAVLFWIDRDPDVRIKFAALQSETGQYLLEKYNLSQEYFESLVLIERGQVYQKSAGILRMMRVLPWYWQIFRLGGLIPRPLRDALYDWMARNRYRWFGQRAACRVPTPDLQRHFLD